jgi:hypothetical protein
MRHGRIGKIELQGEEEESAELGNVSRDELLLPVWKYSIRAWLL